MNYMKLKRKWHKTAFKLIRRGFFALLFLSAGANAVILDDLYNASVGICPPLEQPSFEELANLSINSEVFGDLNLRNFNRCIPEEIPLKRLFEKALDEVLIKVTGRSDILALRTELFPDASKPLLEYRQLPNDKFFAGFDNEAIRKSLDSFGQPIWGEQRPLVAIWLAIDTGNGKRYILSDGSQENESLLASIRGELLSRASKRGLPVVLPLLDTVDMMALNFSDIWGGFLGQIDLASSRYKSEALLIGRFNATDVGEWQTRWIFSYDGQLSDWQSPLFEGVDRVADILSDLQATSSKAINSINVRISGINSISSYGELRKYLNSLDILSGIDVISLQSDELELVLALRGESVRLQQIFQNSNQLNPVSPNEDSLDLHYKWILNE
ncbi:MAG: DUF2066 domain-containing protein [Pseudomonadota bacterium]|nr:DUF2066 domain-containing protein [Pseudomonadota bacterium]